MHFVRALVSVVAVVGVGGVVVQREEWGDANALLKEVKRLAMANLTAAAAPAGSGEEEGCSVHTAVVRRDWANMAPSARRAYIAAVQCLFTLPSLSDPIEVPGARSRYDDFVAQHINQTMRIHDTGNFLSWHRYFVHAYETALRDECGYEGYQPYWNWFDHQDNLTLSSVFDGSDTSLGSDGKAVPHAGIIGGAGKIPLPVAGGGGCVERGPFVNTTIHLGPIRPANTTLAVPSPLAHNPRCLSRDLNPYPALTWLTATNLHNLTLGPASENISTFQSELQGRPLDGFLGMHAAGHYVIGGDAGDFFASPVDPAFYLHHAMLDSVWWAWQALYPGRARDIAGTLTLGNKPPSREASVEDLVGGRWLGVPEVRIRDVLNTVEGGPLCYVYE